MSGVPVTITILDKEYQVACPAEEVDALRASAQYLSQRMREIRDNGKVLGADRIAVMAALNITRELLNLKTLEHDCLQAADHIGRLQQSISSVLHPINEQNELELNR
ncbi:MAG: cell division protein ZapA [Gammaproteobacteria bacterium]|nr:cell division protein ZapA [Gammaproteobacteria bacterium]